MYYRLTAYPEPMLPISCDITFKNVSMINLKIHIDSHRQWTMKQYVGKQEESSPRIQWEHLWIDSNNIRYWMCSVTLISKFCLDEGYRSQSLFWINFHSLYCLGCPEIINGLGKSAPHVTTHQHQLLARIFQHLSRWITCKIPGKKQKFIKLKILKIHRSR